MKVLFDNIVNARDLGGLIGAGGKAVRPHRLLRSAHLHDASPADLLRLKEEYNLRKIFDFRSLDEAKYLPDRNVEGAEHHLLPTIDLSAEKLTEQPIPQEAFLDIEKHIVNYSFYPEVQKMAANMYPSLICSEYSQLQYAAFLRLIIEAPEDSGVLWHCYQGKDRTGWGAAFLLSALGVEREQIIEDFDLSNEAYRKIVATMYAEIDERGGGDAEKEVILAFIGVSTPNFIRTLDLIDRQFDGMMNYLHEQLMLTHDDIQILRKRYLE